MEIILAKNAGHCLGVKTAIQKTLETVAATDKLVYTLGPLIHNPQVVAKLKKSGVRVVKDLSKIKEGVIIIRSHGVAPQVVKKIKAKGLEVVDATCPFVKRAHKLARESVIAGYNLVILGDAKHPEVEGILGAVNYRARVISGDSEVKKLPRKASCALLAQTTQSIDNLKKVSGALLSQTHVLKILNTTCNATTKLQAQTRVLARKVDLMLVIGGYNSANTTRLASICSNVGVRTYHIETVAELKKSWLPGVRKVGITGGTSTPSWVIEEIVNALQ